MGSPTRPSRRWSQHCSRIGSSSTSAQDPVQCSGIVLAGFVPATLYLIRADHDRFNPSRTRSASDYPQPTCWSDSRFQLHAFASPNWTFARADRRADLGGSVLGTLLGLESEGRVAAFGSWVVYAAYLHARATPSINPHRRLGRVSGLAVNAGQSPRRQPLLQQPAFLPPVVTEPMSATTPHPAHAPAWVLSCAVRRQADSRADGHAGAQQRPAHQARRYELGEEREVRVHQ